MLVLDGRYLELLLQCFPFLRFRFLKIGLLYVEHIVCLQKRRDLIFLLLAFFIISTMYMTEVRTISIALPDAQSAETVSKSSSLVTIKKDGSCWLDDKKMSLDVIVAEVKKRSGSDANYSVVIRGEKEAAYDDVIHVLDRFKAAGITRFGLAAEQEAGG